VRQLQSAVNWGIAFQDEHHVIHAVDLEKFFNKGPSSSSRAGDNGTLKARIHEFEEREIRKTLAQNNYNMTITARELGISRQQLYNKVKAFNISTRRG
jgi:arginine utilization regulatory protein